MRTVKDKLEEFGGSGPGFDAWRFLLSTLVLLMHTFFVCYGRASDTASSVGFYGAPVFVAILPIFFGLSGFLVAGSALRTGGVLTFLSFRGLRLLPALAVETTLAALILGPVVTTHTLREYFTDHKFFAYFGNIIGRVRYELPGVFETSLEPGVVNLNLWTLHAELECYALMALAMTIGLLNFRSLALGLWAAVTLLLAIWNVTAGVMEPMTTGAIYPAPVFVYSFCTCVIAYLWIDKIPINRSLFFGCIGAYCAIVYFPHTVFLVVPLLSYIMIYLGLSPTFRFKAPGDYSYGMYLYGFVIQQTIAWAFPGARHWWIVFPAALAITVAVSAISWHVIERPALKLKRFVRKPTRPRLAEPALAEIRPPSPAT